MQESEEFQLDFDVWKKYHLFNFHRGPAAQLVEQQFALREVVSSTLAGPLVHSGS